MIIHKLRYKFYLYFFIVNNICNNLILIFNKNIIIIYN